MPQVACLQLNTQSSVHENIAHALEHLYAACNAGAEWVVTPENTGQMADPTAPRGPYFSEEEHPALEAFCEAARKHSVWITIGSLQIATDLPNKCANRSFLINPKGIICARYDKIHLFDATLKAGETYRESERCITGKHAVLASMPWGNVGFSICYDVRFPHLFRTLAKHGADYFTVPAAFTVPTGRAHWHVLLRARAIENGCYVLAPAQTGIHPGGRATFGHSLIIDPWGEILAEAGTEPGYIMASLQPDTIRSARSMLPSLEHDRPFDFINATEGSPL